MDILGVGRQFGCVVASDQFPLENAGMQSTRNERMGPGFSEQDSEYRRKGDIAFFMSGRL
jgi:hypothetical protein